jgi:DNA polymerase-3 subunit gamma/tau
MTQALYRLWRPQTWEEVVGQDHVVQTLRNAVRAGRVAHAYLFAGPRGTGKTTTARLIAKAVNCLAENPGERPCNVCRHCVAVNEGRFLDLIEIDAASNTSVEDVRDLRDKITFSPNEGRYKVYIVDEVHMLSTAAFNALLKTLEEPPAHAIFVLATTEVHKIPATVLSRCQRHEFRRLPLATILDYLKDKASSEGLKAEPEALELIARQATGSLRDAISLLDQLASTGETVTLPRAQLVLGTATSEVVSQVVRWMVEGDVGRGLTELERALDAGIDPRQMARQIVGHLRSLLMFRLGDPTAVDVPVELRADLAAQAGRVPLSRLLRGIEAFNRAAFETRDTWLPGLTLELALVEAAGSGTEGSDPGAAARGAPPQAATPPKPPARATGAMAEVSPSKEPSSSSPNFQGVMDRWKAVMAAAFRQNPRTQALLNSCKPLGIEGGLLVLGFSSDLLREKMEMGHNLALVRQALQETLGVPLGVKCVLAKAWGEGTAQDDAPPPMEENGMVATALRDLGAQVVEVKPLPPELEG